MLRLLTALPLLLCLALAAPATAATVRVPAAVDQRCADGLRSGSGVATERYTADRDGFLTVRLAGSRGDWDLAVFRSPGRTAIASATAGAREQTVAYVARGETVTAQACLRTGDGGAAELTFDHFAADLPTATEPVRIVHVPLDGAAALDRLEDTGLDVTHDSGPGGADVVLYGAADERRLRDAGFTFTTRIADLGAVDRVRAQRDAEFRSRVSRSALPSGNTSYRTPADYSADLKELVDNNAGLVRAVDLGDSLEGRPIEGVEIAENVARADDGRPVLALFGLHHAREWPSGEMPMEFAIDLVQRYNAGEARVTELLRRVRVVAVPVVNPDGFRVSRSFDYNPATDNVPLPSGAAEVNGYKRKNCRPTAEGDPSPCEARPQQGVDLNRNYGAYWGGTGSSTTPTAQNYRGPGPYSEPESEAVHVFSQRRSPVTVISHHTYTADGVWLRQPGFCMVPPDGCQSDRDLVPDEAGMKALGDGMGTATGWDSELGWAIGEITGATEDWNYFATGAYGYTPEQRGVNFHPDFETAVADEFDGTASGAGGVREALMRAAEQAADDAQHSVLTGSAPAGSTLRLTKAFSTPTMQDGVVVDDRLDLTLTAPASGRFEWDVNPSTRPLAGSKEAYTLSCEQGGAVLASRQVVVDRGQRLDVGDACSPVAGTPPSGDPSVGTTTQQQQQQPGTSTRRLALSLRLDRRQRLSTVLRRGVLVRATCALDCTLGSSVRRSRLGGIYGRRTLSLRAGKRLACRVRLTRTARRSIVRRRTGRVALRLVARTGAQQRTVVRGVTLVRR